jgi:hypothetical protein
MNCPEYQQDNQWLATEILRLVPKGSTVTQFVDTARNDGRAMFLILKRDCLGNNWQNARSFEVTPVSVIYCGMGRVTKTRLRPILRIC